jgi:hypothetical protein
MTRTLTFSLFALALLAASAAPAAGRHHKKLVEDNPASAPGPEQLERKAAFPKKARPPHSRHIRPAEGAPAQAQRPVHQDQGQNKDRGLGWGPTRNDHGPKRAVAVPKHLHSLGVRNMPPQLGPRQRLEADAAHSSIAWPKEGPHGRALRAEGFVAREHMNEAFVHEHFRAMVQDRALLADVRRFGVEERVAGRYYWHSWHGNDFCHYYDPWGYHWYGWYLGPRFFWVRYHSGGWWWYDPLRIRWCFWYDGFWWWQDPLNISLTYVYNGTDYVPSQEATSESPTAQSTALPAPPDDIPSLPSPEPTGPGPQ